MIEKRLRDALGLQPGYIAVQRLVDDHVELYFYPPEHEESLRGMLADYAERSIPPETWRDATEQGWSRELQSRWSRPDNDT